MDPVVGLVSVLLFGIAAQWVAWRLKLPSILLLLVAGVGAGPMLNILRPDQLLGDLLEPLVALAVALILFEGSLTLSFASLRQASRVVLKLVTLGALLTWTLLTISVFFLLKLSFPLALLLGAILIVSGPTVIGPLLLYLRPTGKVGTILKWESILIDPLGAVLAVLVFEGIRAQDIAAAGSVFLLGALEALAVGTLLGILFAMVTGEALKRHFIPDSLVNPAVLTLALGCYALANQLYPEAGLLGITVMGVSLANQTGVPVRRILEFKETVRLLLISALFVLLAARLHFEDWLLIRGNLLDFLAVLFFVARPLAVGISTRGENLTSAEILFLSWMAPRGIVAASVASVFALRLTEWGHPEAKLLVPYTFAVIFATVAVYGLTAPLLARKLKLAMPNPQGVLVLGAHPFAQSLAELLSRKGLPTLLADTNWEHVQSARMRGLPVYYGSLLSEQAREELELGGIGKFLALTPNSEANALSGLQFADLFGHQQIYQLAPEVKKSEAHISPHLRGRLLRSEEFTYTKLQSLFQEGFELKSTKLSKTFSYQEYLSRYKDCHPLACLRENGELIFWTSEAQCQPRANDLVIALVREVGA